MMMMMGGGLLHIFRPYTAREREREYSNLAKDMQQNLEAMACLLCCEWARGRDKAVRRAVARQKGKGAKIKKIKY